MDWWPHDRHHPRAAWATGDPTGGIDLPPVSLVERVAGETLDSLEQRLREGFPVALTGRDDRLAARINAVPGVIWKFGESEASEASEASEDSGSSGGWRSMRMYRASSCFPDARIWRLNG